MHHSSWAALNQPQPSRKNGVDSRQYIHLSESKTEDGRTKRYFVRLQMHPESPCHTALILRRPIRTPNASTQGTLIPPEENYP